MIPMNEGETASHRCPFRTAVLTVGENGTTREREGLSRSLQASRPAASQARCLWSASGGIRLHPGEEAPLAPYQCGLPGWSQPFLQARREASRSFHHPGATAGPRMAVTLRPPVALSSSLLTR